MSMAPWISIEESDGMKKETLHVVELKEIRGAERTEDAHTCFFAVFCGGRAMTSLRCNVIGASCGVVGPAFGPAWLFLSPIS